MLRSIAVAAAALAASTVWASAQDAAAGEKAFGKCKTCHDIGPGAKAKVGPPLTGIVGRPVASVEGYGYSSALKGKAGELGSWDEGKLDTWLTDPQKVAPGTKMTLKVASPDERKNIIAYLASQK